MSFKNRLSSALNTFAQKRWLNGWIVKLISAPLCWIMLLSAAGRACYYSVLLPTRAYDSTGYLNYKANVLLGQTEGLRTPVYPYFIKLIGLLGQNNLLDHIVTAQIIISFLSLILFYKVVSAVFQKQAVINTASLWYGLMLPVINFDKMILTESLSAVGSLFFIYQLMRYLQKPGLLRAVWCTLFVCALIMLRPSFIYLLPLVVVFWLLRIIVFRNDWKNCLGGLAASAMVILLITGYSALNKKNANFNGISVVSNNNGIAVVIGANIYQSGNDPEIAAAIDSNKALQLRRQSGLPTPVQNYVLNFEPDRMHRFIATCIRNQPYAYVQYISGKMIDIQNTNIFTNYATHRLNYLAFRIENIEYFVFFISFNILFLLLEADLILLLIRWVKRRQTPWFKLMLWMMVAGQVAVALMGGYSEYARLIVPAMPGLLILFFTHVDRVLFAIDASRLKSYPVS